MRLTPRQRKILFVSEFIKNSERKDSKCAEDNPNQDQGASNANQRTRSEDDRYNHQ